MQPTEEQIRRIWSHFVLPVVFEDAKHEQEPMTVFLGGQPGAGKTAGAIIARRLNPSHVITPIVGDDYRRYHPDYMDLLKHDPLSMPSQTAHAEGKWIGMCVDHADREGYSASIEGTWRNPATVLDEAVRAKRLGRSTHAVIVAVPYALSRVRALERFVSGYVNGGMGRWTPPAAQEAVADSLSQSVKEISLSPLIDRFTVVGSRGIVFDSQREPRAMGWQAWHGEFSRALSPQEREEAETKISAMRDTLGRLSLRPDDLKAVRTELDAVTRMQQRTGSQKQSISRANFRRMAEEQSHFDSERPEDPGTISLPKRDDGIGGLTL